MTPTSDPHEHIGAIGLSIVVVAHDMARELPQTLRSLSPRYQRDVGVAYEVIVVDNGSPVPIPESVLDHVGGPARLIRLDPAPSSPARAANTGIAAAVGPLVGLIVDGARMASPGLLAQVLRAARLSDRAVIATPGWHLGTTTHMEAADHGYDQSVEDALLAEIGWEADGYRLFEVSSFAASSGRGWFGPMGESSALFLPADLWAELGGLDEAFALPGGGLVNHDLYLRACALEGSELVVIIGEGTFHQIHGGAATSRRFSFEEMQLDYETIRGVRHRPPDRPPLYLGSVSEPAFAHLQQSVRLASERRERRRRAEPEAPQIS